MNYFEHHIGDYDADTSHLTWLEDMAYTRLIRLYYRREKPIPADVGEACRLVRAAAKDQKQAVADVLNEFFILEADGWHQSRCDAEVAKYAKKVEHNRVVGKLGGRPRKAETHKEPTGLFPGSETEPKQNPLQTPDTKHQETKTPQPPEKSGGDDPEGFAEFWNSWPSSTRKQDRKKCAAKWKRSGFSSKLVLIVAHVEDMKRSKTWRDGFEPAPLTYLNGERWADGAFVEAVESEGFI